MQKQRFGELARQLGFLTDAQLEQVLSIQAREDDASMPRRPIGIICMQEGLLSFDQVVRILEKQEAARLEAN
jgi:hypothetical protein